MDGWTQFEVEVRLTHSIKGKQRRRYSNPISYSSLNMKATGNVCPLFTKNPTQRYGDELIDVSWISLINNIFTLQRT